MQVSDIKLALNGQIYDSEGLLYSYPERLMQLHASGQFPEWINALPYDSRFLRNLVNVDGECFSIRYGQEGLYYAYTRYNPHDSRNGTVYVALYMGNRAASNGKELITVLRNLMDYFLEKNSPIGIQDAEVEKLLGQISDPYTIAPPDSSTQVMQDAYRIYQNESDLYECINWAIQKKYTDYRWVHFISSAHKKAVVDGSYTELNSRIIPCYSIRTPEGNTLLLGGTNHKLKYTNDGYLPQEVTFTVGQANKFVTIDENNVIHPKPLKELGLTFKKRVTILLCDESSKMPIVEDGRQICKTVELMENTPKQVSLVAEGYRSKTITLNPSEIASAEINRNEYLQRDAFSNTGWDPDDYEEGTSRKKLMIFLAIAFIVGVMLGFGVQKFVLSGGTETKEEANPALESLIKENKTLQAEIEQLKKETSDLGEQLKDKDSVIQNKNNTINELKRQITELQNPSQTSGQTADKTAIEKANEKALKYLNNNKEKWCILYMKGAAGEEYYKETECYKYLEVLLTANVSDSVIKSFDTTKIENDIWKKMHRKLLSLDAVKIKDALNKKEVNSHYSASPGKKDRLNGTINIKKLNNILLNILNNNLLEE